MIIINELEGFPTSEENREDQDHPEIGTLCCLNGRDSKQCNFRRCIESETEEHTQRIHFPGPKLYSAHVNTSL